MKKLLLLLSIVFMRPIQGQITFPAPGADWHYEVQNGGFSGPYYYNNTEVKYTHDTLLMGKTAKVLSTNVSYFTLLGISSGNVYVYTSNDSVFFYNSKTLNQWQLLYSFGTPAGQSWQFRLQDMNGIDTIKVKVDSIKNTLINSLSLKTLFVTYTEINHPSSFAQTHNSVIYDRIGDTTYLFNFLPDIFPLCDGCSRVLGILCYSDSTLGLYQNDITKSCNYLYTGIQPFANQNPDLHIYPNPTNGTFTIKSNTTDKLTVDLFDINGRHLLSTALIGTADINANSLNNGVYTLTIKSNTAIAYKKLVIAN